MLAMLSLAVGMVTSVAFCMFALIVAGGVIGSAARWIIMVQAASHPKPHSDCADYETGDEQDTRKTDPPILQFRNNL
jgi:hypothetical protein